jgi:hypothetical protein
VNVSGAALAIVGWSELVRRWPRRLGLGTALLVLAASWGYSLWLHRGQLEAPYITEILTVVLLNLLGGGVAVLSRTSHKGRERKLCRAIELKLDEQTLARGDTPTVEAWLHADR